MMWYSKHLKPIFDFLISFSVLVVSLPLSILVAAVLFIANRGGVFFLQKRVGKDERIFTVVKFKTMNDRRDKNNQLLPDSERITSIGRFIRSTSLDEIPQLFNVLKGEMSLVGPRPLLVKYLPLYSETQAQRHQVKPGITGWAQVNGRNTITWQQKFEYDVWYVRNISFTLDIRILLLTLKKVIAREGIASDKRNISMDPFLGNE